MREMPIIKLSVLILIAGFVIGGWRSWNVQHSARSSTASGAGVTQLELLTTADKAGWIRSQVFAFNMVNNKRWQVTVHYQDSRAAMEKLLGGGEKPLLWSPESPVWVARASDVWRQRTGHPLVHMDDFSRFRVFLRSPVVFLTTREKAGYLSPYLSGSRPWHSIRDMGAGTLQPPWGTIRYSIPDPLQSSSGTASLGMVLLEYSRDRGTSAPVAVAADPRFGSFLGELAKGMVYDADCRAGTAALTDAYTGNVKSRDFIVTYENLALSAARKNKDLVVIYPNPTTAAEQSVALIDAPWGTDEQRAGAQAFMNYISLPQSLRSGVRYNMRLAISGAGDEADRRFKDLQLQGFQQNYVTEDFPQYDALNLAAAQWRKHAGR